MKHAFARGLLSARVSAAVLGMGFVFAAGQALAYTPAGTDINNRATVTYEDANGNEYSAQSNESSVTVAEVYFATLEQDGEKFGAPGETVYFPHTLTNTGNSTDTYTVGAVDDGTAASYTVYRDTNGNGVPDAGEPAVTSISLNADERAELIVAVPVPANATAGTEIDATLTVTSDNSGEVDDLTDGNGVDTLEGTNNDKVTVSTDAVLQLSKTASVAQVGAGGTITYTLQVSNTGGSPATDVVIADAIPAGTSFDAIVSVNGLLATNGDAWLDDATWQVTPQAAYPAAANLTNVDEPAGEDLNGNGVVNEQDLVGIRFRDAELGANTTVTIVYRVTVDAAAAAGDLIRNTFIVGDEGANPTDPLVDTSKSNTTTTTVIQTFDVDVTDTGDGADDDGTLNDVALQDSAAAGSVVAFANIIANNGNGEDSFDLAISNDGGAGYGGAGTVPAAAQAFPAGTLFTFWDANNNVQLTDTNGNGIADTGAIASGENRRITVRAKLPAGVNGSGDYVATMVATSFGDNTVFDDKLEVLDEITAPSVDLANSQAALVTAAGDGSADAFVSGAPITTNDSVAAGGVTTFPLFVANNSGNAQSFILGAQLPDGWSVTFQEVGVDTDADGTADNTANAGNTVTSTPNLPAGAIYQYNALVQVSSVVDQALADFTGTVTSSSENAVDGNTDGDGDYPVIFTVQSSSDSNVNDKKLDAVDVDATASLSVTPDGANQVQPGGNVDYTHIIANNGNTTEDVTITTANSLAGDGWNNTTQLFVDGTGWVELSNLTGSVDVRTPNGNIITVVVDNSGADTIVTLEPGQRLDVKVTVFAPSTASEGTVDTFTLTATGTVSDSAEDTTEVVRGQVRLNKQAAVDVNCDCDSGTWPVNDGDFMAVQSAGVKPGECVVWKLTATNEGASAAQEVVITDEVTEFTDYKVAKDATATLASGADIAPVYNDPTLTWSIGELASGESSTAHFCVEVK